MIDHGVLAAVILAYLPGVLVPGPNFIAVVHKSVAASRLEAIALVLGIVTVNLFWSTCAIAGFGTLLTALPTASFIVKVLGGIYLVWFGLNIMLSAKTEFGLSGDSSRRSSLRSAFLQGVLTNIGNPKAIAFYMAIFSASVPGHVSLNTFAAILIMVALVSFSWYGLVAIALSRSAVSLFYLKTRKPIDRLCGFLLLAVGIRQFI